MSALIDTNNKEHIPETNHNMSPLIDISSYNNEQSLEINLQTFIIEHNILHNSANELLRILRKYGHAELSSDVRTLVIKYTPRNASAKVKCMGNGHYAHFGLAFGLERSIKINSKFIKINEIKINVNIDSLPVSKSSSSQFWLLMASIEGIDVYTLPFIIGIYHGMSKPNS